VRAAKRDANERAVIDALEKIGCFVTQMWPPAPFDLLVGYRGAFCTFEVKSLNLGRLTPNEAEFQRDCVHYELPYAIVYSPEEAIYFVTASGLGDG
jgi:hypothetical protein